MRFIKGFMVFLLSVYLASPLSMSVEAANAVSFAVQAVLPDNQVEGKATYFDIEVEPKQEQTLEVILTNEAEHEIQVAVSLNQAATNANGVVTYDGSQENFEADLKYPIGEIAHLSSEIITIPAASQETVSISLVAPAEPFDGQILAGVHFLLLANEAEEAAGTSIQNMFAYEIGLRIVSTESDKLVEPVLELRDIELAEINFRRGLQTTFANTAPVFISKLKYEGAVYAKDSDQAIFSRQLDSLGIAPNNQFNLPITFDHRDLEAGDYVFKATISNEDHQWAFEKAFEVKK